MISPVTVIGGAGRTGRLVAAALLAEGTAVRVASRHASRAKDLIAKGASAYDVDVRDGTGLADAVRGAAAVVYSVEPGTANSGPTRPETTMYLGVRHVLEHCASSLERFVLLSSIYVTRPEHEFNSWGRLLDWRLRGEDAVRGSGLPYTVIRPAWLTDHKGAQGIRLEQGDTGDGQISRSDVASACLHALTSPAAAGVTFEMYNEPGKPPADWDSLFSALERDAVSAR